MTEIEEEIIETYKLGISISEIMEEYPQWSRKDITQLLKNNQIAIRQGRKKKELTNEQISTIKEMIAEGALLKDIVNYCKLDPQTTKRLLQENNLVITNKNRINRRIDSNYFSQIDSPIKAYWLGFLFTDGCVDHYRKTGRIRLQLQEADIEILEKFKEDLQIDSKIIYDKRDNSTCCSVEFVDEQIFNDLGQYGIIPNKTYQIDRIPYEKIPKEYLKSYVLGLFDGDGGLSYSKDYSTDVTLSYTAYHETEVIDFQYLINSLASIEKTNKNFFTSAWHTQWRGRIQVLKILDILYEQCPRHLKRKYDKYLALKNSLK